MEVLDGRLESRVGDLVAVFGLGRTGRLSDGPVASGRLGAIWRLDTDTGSWAVKQVGDVGEMGDAALAEIVDGAAFQEAAAAAGVPTPAVVRTPTGDLIADLGDVRVRVHGWRDLEDATIQLDPGDVGRLLAALHQVNFTGSTGVDPWYSEPVTAGRWREIVDTLRNRRAPFAEDLAAEVPEIVALEAFLGGPPKSLRTCHRDLWADNVRRTPAGGLCVFDFDNAGLADPSQELAAILVEYAGHDRDRAAAIRAAYADAGGPGRVVGPTDFAMPIAQLAHIAETGCRRWLAATSDDERADNEAWVREYLDRPVTRAQIETLLDE
ncbi:MAG TPA: aminoglycoside phosphotransferase family protein [Candidatus Limnocylindrales bacterium]